MSEDRKPPGGQLGKIALKRKLVSSQDAGIEPSPPSSRVIDKEPRAPGVRPSSSPPEASSATGARARSSPPEASLGTVGRFPSSPPERGEVPRVDLDRVTIDLELMDVVPRQVAVTLRLLPILVQGDRMFVAMADPYDKSAIDEVAVSTGKKVHPRLADPAQLLETIGLAYESRARGDRLYKR